MYVFTQAQMDLITQTAGDPNPLGGNALANMYDLIYQIIQQPDAFGNTADASVVAWFGAAAQANRGEGGASDLIRAYTHAQLVLRTGDEISNISSVLQNASNEIAESVLADIRGSEVIVNGEKYYTLPTLHEIGEKDAAATLGQLSEFSAAPGIWSGNPLFIGLGDSSFWNGTILEDTSDTYELIVSMRSLMYAGINSIQNMTDLVSLWWGQGGEGREAALMQMAQAISQTDTFLQEAYGRFGSNVISITSSAMTIGRDISDSLDQGPGVTADALIHGGGGDDILIGSSGNDTIDGGSGINEVTFESGSLTGEFSNLTAYIYDLESGADFSAYVEGIGVSAAVFNAAELSLGKYDDILIIDSLAPGSSSLGLVFGGEHNETGDTIDLSNLTSNTGAVISLQGGDGGAGSIRVDLSQIAVSSFENVIGSEKDDSIKGSEETNVIQGGDGDDTIDGGGGADLLAGGAGSDTLNIDLVGATAPVIVWGGDGADTLSITTDGEIQLGIMMVNVTDLTDENFHQLDLEALGMPDDFDWSKIGAIVVNAESDDEITYNGQSLRGHEETVIAQDRVWYSVRTDNPEPGTVAWGDALLAAGYEVVVEETYTFAEGNMDLDGSYRYTELIFEAETSETYMAIGNQDDGTLCEVNSVQGSFLSGSQDFNILSPAVFRPVVAVSQDTESDYNSIHSDLPVEPILTTSTISYSYTPEGADEAIDVSYILEFYRLGYHAYPDGWMEEPGGVFIPPDPDSYVTWDFYFGYMTSEEIVINTAETIGDWYVVGGKMDESGGIVSDDTITISIGEDPVMSAARHDFL